MEGQITAAYEQGRWITAVAVAFESADPYADFRASMEEMVAAYGIGDWGWLEEMLGWYLRANDVDTHCAIVADRSKCPTGSGAGDDR